MNLAVGDRVKFLNEKGSGIIAGIVSSSMAIVRIEEGFEIPVAVSELIKMEGKDDFADIFNKDGKSASESGLAETGKDDNYIENNDIIPLKKSRLLEYEQRGIYFAYVPSNQKLLMSGNIDLFLVNHTEASLLYSIYLRDGRGRYYAKSYGIVDEESKLLLESINNRDIEKWTEGYVQFLYFIINNTKINKPVDEKFSIKTYKTFSEPNFRLTPFFDNEKAVVIMIAPFEEEADVNEMESQPEESSIAESLNSKKNKEDDFEETFINRYIKDEGYAEIDMHIWELVDKFSSLSPNDIYRIQMNFFSRCMDSAMVNRLRKVVFIHGVGNGTLRKDIRSRLAEEYPEITVYDAPIDKYGIGATEIIIPYNYKV